MILAIILFLDSFVNIVTITFTTLVLIETLNVITTVHKVEFLMMVSIIATLAVYFASIVTFR